MGDTKAYKKGAMEPGLTTGIRFLYRQTWPCFFRDKVLLNKITIVWDDCFGEGIL